MNKGHIITTLALILIGVSVAWAQDDQTPPPAPPPVPAFGQESPAPAVTENPPISAVDQPGLEPHAAPESFLLPGIHLSESVDSNAENELGQSSVSPVERALGSLTLQKLWRNYDLAMDYIGGVDYFNQSGIGLQQIEQFDLDNRINWKRGQLGIRDSLSYLPEGTFGFGAYGGSGAYNSSLGSLGASLLGGAAFGGQTSAFNGGNGVSIGQAPRLTNLALVDVAEELTPRSSVTISGGSGIVHFYGDLNSIAGENENITFLGSREETGQIAYDRIMNPKDQIALSYGYQGFDFSTVDTAFHSSVIQAMYGHRISGRMDFLLSAGPQFTHINENPEVCSILNVTLADCTADLGTVVVVPQKANHIGVAGRISLRYRFPKTSVAVSYQRYNTSGSGVFAGSRTDVAQLDASRPLTRVWDVFADLGYSKNTQLQVAGSSVDAGSFTYGFAGVGVHRQFGRNFRGYVSYQFNELGFNTSCPLGSTSTSACSNTSQRQIGTIGVDWTPRPIRLN
jgi:hypothetical protein